ncbi:uncharacterized protein LOC132264127 [Phlebotomus argentipes]|uniref:uncharacterized protein LOC132264127 n=1 Tax=Phlebotomus argentipes TaxID=94469 RepID=UPI0028933220|nr:uncharacterized protein LOC132264127 [Phlebotomus argentipes]
MIRRIVVNSVIPVLSRRKSVKLHTGTVARQDKKQVVEKIHPFSHINVNFGKVSRVKILPYDLLDCPDANILRATVSDDSAFSIRVLGNDVNVDCADQPGASEVTLEIPVKADLSVKSDGALELSDLHSDKLAVSTSGGISTRNLRSESIRLHSERGDIVCQGLTQGFHVQIKTGESGSVSLEKVLGEELQVDTVSGSISTESCYSTSSKFTSRTGNLTLNCVHRNAEVNIVEQGNLTMFGFNGTLLAKVHCGNIRLQLAELWGENVVITNESKEVCVNVSDAVVDSTYVHAAAVDVHVDESLQHLRGQKETGATTLGQKSLPNKLFVQTKGRLEIKRLSWVDAIKLKM